MIAQRWNLSTTGAAKEEPKEENQINDNQPSYFQFYKKKTNSKIVEPEGELVQQTISQRT
jgi:hypothetical protein